MGSYNIYHLHIPLACFPILLRGTDLMLYYMMKWVSLYATGENWGSAIRACSKSKIWTFLIEWHFLCRKGSCEAPKVGKQPLISSICRGGPYSNYNIDMIDKRVFIYTTGGKFDLFWSKICPNVRTEWPSYAGNNFFHLEHIMGEPVGPAKGTGSAKRLWAPILAGSRLLGKTSIII